MGSGQGHLFPEAQDPILREGLPSLCRGSLRISLPRCMPDSCQGLAATVHVFPAGAALVAGIFRPALGGERAALSGV